MSRAIIRGVPAQRHCCSALRAALPCHHIGERRRSSPACRTWAIRLGSLPPCRASRLAPCCFSIATGPPRRRAMSEIRPHILCVGGGWVAVKLVRSMRPALWTGKAELTVVSRDNYLTIHGLVAEALTGKVQPQQIIAPARRVFRPARFHNAEVEAIDLENRTVTTT